nr:NSP2 [Rotavirus A]
MAELVCLCYPVKEGDGQIKWRTYTRLAIKAMLTAKVPKDRADKFYNTIVYGIAPPPHCKKRFNTSDNSRGMNVDNDMYPKICTFVAGVLNAEKVNDTSIVNKTVSIRHLENLVLRMENPEDVLHHSVELQVKSVLIALGLSKDIETTETAEGGEIVFQNDSFTMWKLNYLDHQVMPILDKNFLEYKVTKNHLNPIPDGHVKELVSELRWQYNRMAPITHGKGHYRIVKFSNVANHADRVFASFKANSVKGNAEFDQLDQRVIWPNWFAFTSSMKQGLNLDACKKTLFTKIKPTKDHFKGLSAERRFEEASQVGV